MRPEAIIEESACARILREFGVQSRKMTTPGHRGTCDRMFLVPGGRPLLIEFKVPGEKPDPLQVREHELLRRLG